MVGHRLCLQSTSQMGKTVFSNCLTRHMYLDFRPLPSELPLIHISSAPRFVLVWLKQKSLVGKIAGGVFCRTQIAERRMVISGIERETGRYIIYDKLIP